MKLLIFQKKKKNTSRPEVTGNNKFLNCFKIFFCTLNFIEIWTFCFFFLEIFDFRLIVLFTVYFFTQFLKFDHIMNHLNYFITMKCFFRSSRTQFQNHYQAFLEYNFYFFPYEKLKNFVILFTFSSIFIVFFFQSLDFFI